MNTRMTTCNVANVFRTPAVRVTCVSRVVVLPLLAFVVVAALTTSPAAWAAAGCPSCAASVAATQGTNDKGSQDGQGQPEAKVSGLSEKAAPMLWGVVVSVLPEKGGLLIKHEEVPGVMKAMTMLLRVDEATLKVAKKNQVVKGRLVRKDGVWWLEEAKLAD
ncbi:copper-binding protein [Geminisphaera colitermitum]|uniref:copper-binding protein n=1 Tax=Geminisphaera colitermitum TaxID=1148786 RepID=UPI001E492906|nr:copper-binding protein [Geminisphaera colitermitum]